MNAILQIFRIFLGITGATFPESGAHSYASCDHMKYASLVNENFNIKLCSMSIPSITHVTRRCLAILEVSKIQIRVQHQSTDVDIRKSDGFPSLFEFHFFRHFSYPGGVTLLRFFYSFLLFFLEPLNFKKILRLSRPGLRKIVNPKGGIRFKRFSRKEGHVKKNMNK